MEEEKEKEEGGGRVESLLVEDDEIGRWGEE